MAAAPPTTTKISLLTTTHGPFDKGCGFFDFNDLAVVLWIIASATCFLALLSTIYTVFNAYQLWSTINDLENSIIDLIDEACQILLPIGICKQICHPHHIGTVNARYGTKGQNQDVKPGTKDSRYPEDVTFPPSDIEKVYDVMGDEETRKSKLVTVSLEEGSYDEKPPKNSQSDKRKPLTPAAPPTPSNPNLRRPSAEILLTPKQSLKTANEGTKKTASMESLLPKRSREMLTPVGNSAGKRKSGKDRMEPSTDKRSKEQVSGGGLVERRTPSRESVSNKMTNSKKTIPPPPKMGTAEPI